jgi:hypothetical protein
VPPDHSVWLDDDEGIFPLRPEPGQRNLKGAIQRREPGLRSRLGVRCELLAQSKFDDRLLIIASEEGETTAKKCRREIEQSLHRGEILRDSSAQTQTDSLPDPAVS